MSDRILVYGCGDLVWAQQIRSHFGDHWERGRLPELISLGESDQKLTVSLTEELDWLAGWRPRREPPLVQVEIHHTRHSAGWILPRWEILVSHQVDLIAEQLQGVGVLVTPQTWSELPRGRAFLRAWSRAGWNWAPLEEVLDLKFSGNARFVSAGSQWLRIWEPEGSAVIANGPEAACAIEVAPQILEIALTTLGDAVAAEWRLKEEPLSGWFTRQQIVRRLTEVLRDNRRGLELGTPEAPLFLFSSAEARESFQELANLRLTVNLPPVSAAIWWEQIAEPGFVEPPSVGKSRPAIHWESLETILLAHPQEGPGRAELRALHNYLHFNGRPFRLFDPAELVEALEVGSDLKQRLTRWEAEDRGMPEAEELPAEPRERDLPAEQEAVPEELAAEALAPAADPLFAFRPDHLYVGEPHRTEYLKVLVDGEQVPPESVRPAVLAEGRTGYTLAGIPVPRGAIVRIDFEPLAADQNATEGSAFDRFAGFRRP